jgi:hypothetical protein
MSNKDFDAHLEFGEPALWVEALWVEALLA